MRTAGDYALLHANGMPFKEIVNLIRVETLEWKARQASDWVEQKEREAADGEDD